MRSVYLLKRNARMEKGKRMKQKTPQQKEQARAELGARYLTNPSGVQRVNRGQNSRIVSLSEVV
jgi:hypothetical protein